MHVCQTPNTEISQQDVHIGYFSVKNVSGQVFNSVKARHRTTIGGDTTGEWTNVFNNEQTTSVSFIYRTGPNSGWTNFDYWFVEIETAWGVYSTSDTFYCNVTEDDDGNVVLSIDLQLLLTVSFSSSSSCTKHLLGPRRIPHVTTTTENQLVCDDCRTVAVIEKI